MSYDGLPDEELVTLLTLGEKEALAELYSRHVRAVYSLVLHLLQDTGKAEEVTQEVFLNLWKESGDVPTGARQVSHLASNDSASPNNR